MEYGEDSTYKSIEKLIKNVKNELERTQTLSNMMKHLEEYNVPITSLEQIPILWKHHVTRIKKTLEQLNEKEEPDNKEEAVQPDTKEEPVERTMLIGMVNNLHSSVLQDVLHSDEPEENVTTWGTPPTVTESNINQDVLTSDELRAILYSGELQSVLHSDELRSMLHSNAFQDIMTTFISSTLPVNPHSDQQQQEVGDVFGNNQHDDDALADETLQAFQNTTINDLTNSETLANGETPSDSDVDGLD